MSTQFKWTEPDGVRCEICRDMIYLRQLNVLVMVSLMGHILPTLGGIAHLCQACGEAIEGEDPPF